MPLDLSPVGTAVVGVVAETVAAAFDLLGLLLVIVAILVQVVAAVGGVD